MSAELRERLGDLADQVPTVPPPPDLWDRGCRYGRRRTLTQVAVASCCLLLFTIAGSTAWRGLIQAESDPAGGDTPVYLPDRFYEPSATLPDTEEAGPLGPLVAVIEATDDDTGLPIRGSGLVGVSAETGEYRLLHLPGFVPDRLRSGPDRALTSDGRRLAYVTYETEAQTRGAAQVRGIAVYDAVSDKRWEVSLNAAQGVAGVDMGWVGDDLWFRAYEWDQGGAASEKSHSLEPMRWDLPADRVTALGGLRMPGFFDAGSASGGGVVEVGDRSFQIVRNYDDLLKPEILVAPYLVGPLHADPSSKLIAGIAASPEGAHDQQPRSILVGEIPPSAGSAEQRLQMQQVPDTRFNEVLGWRDARHVVAHHNNSPWLMSVDIETGQAERLSQLAGPYSRTEMTFATDLMAAPVSDGKSPPSPQKPPSSQQESQRATVLGVAALAVGLAGIVALWWWRRRVQP